MSARILNFRLEALKDDLQCAKDVIAYYSQPLSEIVDMESELFTTHIDDLETVLQELHAYHQARIDEATVEMHRCLMEILKINLAEARDIQEELDL
jgi:hypothetical protein